MSSWKRVPAKNPPKRVAEFAPIADVVSTPGVVGEVRGFPAPELRPGQKRAQAAQSVLPVIQAPQPITNVAEVRGWPSPLMTRAERRSNRGIRESNEIMSNGEVRGFPNPIAPAVRRNTAAPNTVSTKTSSPVAPKLEQLVVTQLAAADAANVTAVLVISNNTEFLEDTLLSIKRQTHTQWEGVIGILGTPTEDFVKKVKTLVNNSGLNNRVTLNTSLSATNVQEALTELASLATTQYVAFIEVGDIWLPRKLDLQLKYLSEKKDVGIIGTQYRQFGEANTVVNLPAGELQRYDFTKGIPVVFSGVLARRELATFTTEFDSYEYDFYVRNMLANVKLHNIDTIQVLKRVSRASLFNPVDRHPELVREKYLSDSNAAAVAAALAAAPVTAAAASSKPVADDAAKKAADDAEAKRNEMMEIAKKAVATTASSS